MNIQRDAMKADGFNDQEIDAVQEYCASAEASGTFSDVAAVLKMRPESKMILVCRTVAEIADRLRPGVWLDKSEHQRVTDPSGESHLPKLNHRLVCRGPATSSVSDPAADSAVIQGPTSDLGSSQDAGRNRD